MRYLILILILSSCSAQFHLKRAIKKDPSILVQDTVVFTDSVHVITKEVHTDSIFEVSKDTVILQKDKLTIKHFYHNDSVYLWGECESDTIVKWKTYEVPVEKVVYNESWIPKWFWVILPILIILYFLKRLNIL